MNKEANAKTKWQGKSKGTVLGYRIFVFLIKHLGLYAAYILLIFVAFYYFLTEWRSNGYLYAYFRQRQGYSRARSVISLYKNYFVFGQTIIDKIAILSGLEDRFTFEFDGVEHLTQLLAKRKCGVLISAHIGNFEIAEPFFRKVDLELQISTVTTDMERSVIKDYIDSISTQHPTNQFIYIKDDMSHIFEIHQALNRDEVICFTGDRYFEGSKSLRAPFLGKEAQFPAGPFLIASRLEAPVIFVYVMKERHLHYHLYARVAEVKRRDAQGLLNAYIDHTEQMLQRYPLQWFNYFDFWQK